MTTCHERGDVHSSLVDGFACLIWSTCMLRRLRASSIFVCSTASVVCCQSRLSLWMAILWGDMADEQTIVTACGALSLRGRCVSIVALLSRADRVRARLLGHLLFVFLHLWAWTLSSLTAWVCFTWDLWATWVVNRLLCLKVWITFDGRASLGRGKLLCVVLYSLMLSWVRYIRYCHFWSLSRDSLSIMARSVMATDIWATVVQLIIW